MISTEKFQKVEITSSSDLRTWLLTHHNQQESVWLVTYKKNTPDKYVSNSEVLDELMCFGWMDGIKRKLDEEKTMQMISPRKTKYWAKSYKDRIERLTKEKRMHDSGLKLVKEAKENGMWDFMNDVDTLIIPQDLQYALNESKTGLDYFESIPPAAKRNILRWIKLAKTPTTRTKRITQTAELAKQQKQPKPNG